MSTLDQLSAATLGAISVQDVLQLIGTVDEDTLFRLCDALVDRDPAGALVFLDELANTARTSRASSPTCSSISAS